MPSPTFVRARGIPEGIAPVAYHDSERWPEDDDVLTLLTAISMDRYGSPIGFITTNRWVMGENWFRAQDATRLLDAFTIDRATPHGL